MKLVSFRIQNFKSIIDSGWCDLSSDNITALIGQNESGKSSVLQALHSFDTKVLDPDHVRDNKHYPVISCSYSVDKDEVLSVVAEGKLPYAEEIANYIDSNKSRINLKRSWTGTAEANSQLEFEEEGLSNLIDELVAREPIAKEAEVQASDAAEEGQPEETAVVEVTDEGQEAVSTTFSKETFLDKLYNNSPDITLFEDHSSLLPATIDLEEVDKKDSSAPGVQVARNFLAIMGLDSKTIIEDDPRQVRKSIQTANTQLTEDFRKFWDQFIGKSNKIELEVQLDHHDASVPESAGKPYLTFWVKDGKEVLYPKQRSEGVRWFLSFFLQLRANDIVGSDNDVLLVDEPGVCLHAKAQKNVLEVFESIMEKTQIIYTTHSPYLIEVKSIHRILAIQRSEEDFENSETKIFTIQDIGSANRDTLLPIYTLIGVDLSHQQAVKKHNNVILEEPSAFYYLLAFIHLLTIEREINFIPATGATNVTLFVHLFLGWGLDFLVVTDDDPEGKQARREIKKSVFGGSKAESDKYLMPVGKGLHGVEDIFTKTDFRTKVLAGKIPVYKTTNSAYMKDSGKSKPLAGMKFLNKVKSGDLVWDDLAKQSQKNIKELTDAITNRLDELTKG
jgi:ABC-type polar amino acid transport system ATPase subunit